MDVQMEPWKVILNLKLKVQMKLKTMQMDEQMELLQVLMKPQKAQKEIVKVVKGEQILKKRLKKQRMEDRTQVEVGDLADKKNEC